MKKNKFKLIISILVAVVVILVACVAIIFIGKKAMDEQRNQINDLNYELESNKRVVYVASREIATGESLIEDVNVMRQEIYSGLEEDYYMTEDMLGSIAIMSIRELEPIMADMVAPMEITTDAREYEITVANLMTDQTENDYVDVRIMFPTGEDYIILSKKSVKNLIKENCIFNTLLNEDEILRMASATVDAYTITGAYIYTTRYVAPSLQDDSVPNYMVKPEVIDLINSDPNILEQAKETLNLDARISLEERIKGLSEDALDAISSGHEIYDIAGKKALLGVIYESDEEILSDEEAVEESEEDDEENMEENTETEENSGDITTDITDTEVVQ